MMKTVNLFVMSNERIVSNIPSGVCQNTALKSLKTRYMTLTSYDENNEYTGLEIELCSIDCEKGLAHFEKCKDGCESIYFTMDVDDDPIIVFYDDEPGIEHHIFGKICDHEINPEIKQGCLYKFKKSFTNEWFLAVVQCVGTYQITLNRFNVIRDKTFSPTLYTLCQQADIFGISSTDKFCIEKYKDYVVTKICDLTAMFDDENDEEENK